VPVDVSVPVHDHVIVSVPEPVAVLRDVIDMSVRDPVPVTDDDDVALCVTVTDPVMEPVTVVVDVADAEAVTVLVSLLDCDAVKVSEDVREAAAPVVLYVAVLVTVCVCVDEEDTVNETVAVLELVDVVAEPVRIPVVVSVLVAVFVTTYVFDDV
jgi:hypothetical protein